MRKGFCAYKLYKLPCVEASVCKELLCVNVYKCLCVKVSVCKSVSVSTRLYEKAYLKFV